MLSVRSCLHSSNPGRRFNGPSKDRTDSILRLLLLRRPLRNFSYIEIRVNHITVIPSYYEGQIFCFLLSISSNLGTLDGEVTAGAVAHVSFSSFLPPNNFLQNSSGSAIIPVPQFPKRFLQERLYR